MVVLLDRFNGYSMNTFLMLSYTAILNSDIHQASIIKYINIVTL